MGGSVVTTGTVVVGLVVVGSRVVVVTRAVVVCRAVVVGLWVVGASVVVGREVDGGVVGGRVVRVVRGPVVEVGVEVEVLVVELGDGASVVGNGRMVIVGVTGGSGFLGHGRDFHHSLETLMNHRRHQPFERTAVLLLVERLSSLESA
ncbi:MAG: hypothetical protein ACRBK7_27525 [Acidimicrobiales bacterium]